MKKIFGVMIMALVLSLCFTGCASKSAAKNSSVCRVDINDYAGYLEFSDDYQAIVDIDDISPVSGEYVKVIWTAVSDVDIDELYVRCVDCTNGWKELGENENGKVLIADVKANEPFWASTTIPVKNNADGNMSLVLWYDGFSSEEITPAKISFCQIDAK